MKWVGGKHYLNKQLIPVLTSLRRPGQLYVEPFVGGYNSFAKMEGPKLGNDLCPYIIALGNALMAGWLPPSSLSKEEYYEIKANMDSYPKELVAFAAYGCSFGAKWWGGYGKSARTYENIPKSTYNNCVKLAPRLQGSVLTRGNYYDLEIPDGSLVYCDPPYKGTTGYHTSKGFDYDRFYNWVDSVSERNIVLVSERTMPGRFRKVKEFASTHRLKPTDRSSNIPDCLFTLNDKSLVPDFEK